jgi:hypothetical protein
MEILSIQKIIQNTTNIICFFNNTREHFKYGNGMKKKGKPDLTINTASGISQFCWLIDWIELNSCLMVLLPSLVKKKRSKSSP